MPQLTHKQLFNLLIKELNEVYQYPQEDLQYLSKDFLDALNYDSAGLRKYLGEHGFQRDDEQVNSTEQFLLDWIDEVWVKSNGNQELYAKFLQDLRGNLQEFESI